MFPAWCERCNDANDLVFECKEASQDEKRQEYLTADATAEKLNGIGVLLGQKEVESSGESENKAGDELEPENDVDGAVTAELAPEPGNAHPSAQSQL